MARSKSILQQRELNKILANHRIWVESKGERGVQADLVGVNLIGRKLKEVNFQGISLKGLSLQKSVFIRANFEEVDLSKSILYRANLYEANLRGANLNETDLNHAIISGANLEGANLQNAILRSAMLNEAKLQGANLKSADLSRANIEKANLTGAILIDANLINAKINNANFDDVDLTGVKIDRKTLSQFDKNIIEKYGKSFFILGFTDLENFIIRSIEFPPKYFLAGMEILSYFGTILRQKFPNEKVAVNIRQEGLKITMEIETEKGNRERIETALNDYREVLNGSKRPEEFLNNEVQVIALQNQLTIAKAQVESQQRCLNIADYNLKEAHSQIQDLRSVIGQAIAEKTISHSKINVNVSPIIDVKSATHVSSVSNVYPQIALIQGNLNELKEQLPTDSEEAHSINDLQNDIEQIEKASTPEEVAKSSAMSKFRRFIENVERAETTAGQVIKTTKDGIDLARTLAGHYNRIAQWCGLPQIPEPFTKK